MFAKNLICPERDQEWTDNGKQSALHMTNSNILTELETTPQNFTSPVLQMIPDNQKWSWGEAKLN